MKHLTMAVMIVGALALTACDQSSRFGDDAGRAGAAGTMVPGCAVGPDLAGLFQRRPSATGCYFAGRPVARCRAEAQDVLTKQAAWLMENPDYTAHHRGPCRRAGHARIQPRAGRAPRLGGAGLPDRPGRCAEPAARPISYGKERPLAICSDETCYTQNRRAVTVLTSGGDLVTTPGGG